MLDDAILIILFVVFVVTAGIFAGAETGMYQLSRLRLRLGVEKRRLSFVILGKSLQDSPGLLLSMLTGTNLAHYLATSIVTYVLLRELQAEHTAELFATVITAPVLFVFSELIPKNIFFYRADSIMPFFSPFLFAAHKLFSWCQIVGLLKWISGIFARLTGAVSLPKAAAATVHYPHIKAIIHETAEEGLLSPVQTDIINRLAGLLHLNIKAVMTPLSKVQMVNASFDKSALLDKLNGCVFTRLPVTGQTNEDIIGFINIYEALSSSEEFTDLREFTKPIRRLSADTSVTEAISIMQREHEKIVLVTRTSRTAGEKSIGIVTMKDLVEELLGELAEW
jgi:putative hemolysin